ncbi:DNA polymerase III subunit beta [Solemya pervernicosa gill symbiont]|uniref:Beta sliding clamp n=2 Tax=Gammaproteobacteria incertae sedis TaxID=118884 RepID=A0A1T2L4X5_9GAMM|nr:DNA polymerase III subunit beta [Candidatus Reidiella endopervernicosa]OOZ40090.1 DNA polymerase III subunit beta [Solemya pervernicosa gill symbiont]QKQ25404.1 DNA polymerase III subunit beta [Candidatus Reidiella endopervernicosa]
MKFKVQREAILKPLQAVSGVVERRQTLPVLSNVLISAGQDGITFTATDLEVELQAISSVAVDAPGETTVPARKFIDICRALPESAEISFSLEDDRVIVKSGKSRFTLSTLPASDFPSVDAIKNVNKFELPQTEVRRLIERTHFAMAQQDVRYYLNGLMLQLTSERLRAVATDGHRLALSDVTATIEITDDQQVIVPRKGVQELLRLLESNDEMAEIQVGSNHIKVTLPGLGFTSKLIDGRFPDYERVIPSGCDKEIKADRETLKQALTRTSILSNEKYRGVRLHLLPNALEILAHNPEQEQAEDEIEVEYDGQELEIGFNVSYMIDALNVIQNDNVKISLSDANSSCLIEATEGDTSRYVVMPMRL